MGDLEDWENPGIGEGSLPLSTYQLPDLSLPTKSRACYLLHNMQSLDGARGL